MNRVLRLDRTHRFEIGDSVKHVDSVSDVSEIVELTLRISHGVAYPTYTLRDERTDELMHDVLCTLDLTVAS